MTNGVRDLFPIPSLLSFSSSLSLLHHHCTAAAEPLKLQMWRVCALSSSKGCVFSKLFCSNFSSEIFVSRLSHYTTEDELEGLFSQFGKIEEVRLVRDNKTRRPKGFAFVRFESDAVAENAIKGMDKRIVKGRLVFVEMAKSRPE